MVLLFMFQCFLPPHSIFPHSEGLILQKEHISMNIILASIQRFLATYGWASNKEFMLSLFPSAKYGTMGGTISFAAVSAFFVQYLGISPALIPALVVIIATELWTGIRASRKRKEDFESRKFSRFVIKFCVWMVLFYTTHSFMNEYRSQETLVQILSFTFFEVLKSFLMSLFVVENATSILENLAVLDGKPKATYVNKLKELFNAFFSTLKGVFSKTADSYKSKNEKSDEK